MKTDQVTEQKICDKKKAGRLASLRCSFIEEFKLMKCV